MGLEDWHWPQDLPDVRPMITKDLSILTYDLLPSPLPLQGLSETLDTKVPLPPVPQLSSFNTTKVFPAQDSLCILRLGIF